MPGQLIRWWPRCPGEIFYYTHEYFLRLLNILHNLSLLQQSRARAENLGNLVPEDGQEDDEHFTAEQMIQFLNNLAKENNKLSVGREIKWGVWRRRRTLKIKCVIAVILVGISIDLDIFRVWKYKTKPTDSGIRNLNAVSDLLFVAVLIIVIIMGLHCVSYNLQTSSCTAARVYCVTEHPFPSYSDQIQHIQAAGISATVVFSAA